MFKQEGERRSGRTTDRRRKVERLLLGPPLPSRIWEDGDAIWQGGNWQESKQASVGAGQGSGPQLGWGSEWSGETPGSYAEHLRKGPRGGEPGG